MTIRPIKKARVIGLTGLALALSLTAVGIAQSPASARTTAANATGTRCPDESGKSTVKQIDTPHLRMILAVGSPEKMYTQDQVDALGVTTGELMIAGKMDSTMSMAMGGGKNRHVEVSICNLKTGKVLTGATVRMSIAPKGGSYMPMTVAEMRGLDEPRTMSHYGNNVRTPKGAYTVKVKTAGESAVFHVTT